MNTIIAVVFVIIYFTTTIILYKNYRPNVKEMCFCAISIALTLILDSIRIPLPTGATMAAGSMVPLILLAIICDYRLAFLGGWVCGLLSIFLIPAWQPIHWAQIIVEHMVCISCLGYAGIFGSNKRWKILCGILLAAAIKICGHLISGVIFFSQNAWDGFGAWGYSLGYNLSQNIPATIISIVVIMILPLQSLKKIAGRKS